MRILYFFLLSIYLTLYFIGCDAFARVRNLPCCGQKSLSHDPFQHPAIVFKFSRAESSCIHAARTGSDAENPVDLSSKISGVLLLNFVAILWGTQHVCIKSSLESFGSTSLVNFWRFLMSSLIFFPSFLKTLVANNILFLYSFDSFFLRAYL